MPTETQHNVQSRLQGLLQYPREDLAIELKAWLDIWTRDDTSAKENQADLAQAILALANHGGGYILIGFAEAEGTWQADPKRPTSLKGYSQDALNAIVQRFAEPAFHCQMHHVPHPESSELFPVIVVPGGHHVPIRSKADGCNARHVKQNCYYIRRPGPKSEQIQTAQEWDDLIGRCVRMSREELLDDFRSLLYGINGAQPNTTEHRNEFKEWIKRAEQRFADLVSTMLVNEHPDRYKYGVWTFAYEIVGEVKQQSRSQFLELLNQVDAHLTGWPVWTIFNKEDLKPRPFEEVIECWLKDVRNPDPSSSDFWWASPKGKMFLLRGYGDDSERIANYYRIQPGTALDPLLPIWRIGECVLHAGRLAAALSESSDQTVIMHASWGGLAGRALYSWSDPGRHFMHQVSTTDQITAETQVNTEQIEANLPEIVSTLLQPLYDVFGFFQMPIAIIQQELTKMKNRQY